MNEFRLKLNLSKFFSDVRVSAFIFVSSDIETIGDLQNHISNLFKISDQLVLLCDNHFLPAEETVRILKEDEVITVIEGGVRRVKKVKKRKIKEDDSHCELDLMSNAKKKNRGLNESGEVDLSRIEPIPSSKQKKKKQQINEVGAVENGLCELPKLAKTLSKQKERKHINEPVDEKRREFFFKGSVISHRKKVEPMPISTVAKVVKSLKVFDDNGWHFEPTSQQSITFIPDNIDISKKTTLIVEEELPAVEEVPIAEEHRFFKEEVEKPLTDALPEEPEQMDTNETEQPIIVKELEVKTQDKIIIIHSNKKLISDSESVTKLQDESEVDPKTENESLNDTNSSVSTKSKRKRVRKRKTKSKPSLNEVIPTPTPVFRTTYNVKNVHIKFDDDLIPTVLSECAAKPVPEEAVVPPFGKMEEVSLSCEKVEEVSPPCHEVLEGLKDDVDKREDETISLVVNTAECRKEILSYPIMETKPKIKDIIAFKKYVLSENYTPEISDFLIAQVYTFDVKNQELVLDILEGGEQCADPNGKFSLIDPEEEPEDVNRIEMKWCEMIEPRLVYP